MTTTHTRHTIVERLDSAGKAIRIVQRSCDGPSWEILSADDILEMIGFLGSATADISDAVSVLVGELDE